MSINKILVTGANGQLGWELTQLAASYPMYEFIFADRSMFDLSKPELFESVILQWAPQAIINTAAYTAVDKAETEQDLANLINETAVAELARITGENDILFIDSSHMIRPQGDVLKIFLEILPKLKKGVIVHVHDIFTPKNYPEKWLIKENKFWNEQYLLQAILNSNKYKILAPLYYLKRNKFNQLKKVCPYLKIDSKPSSFYFKIIK